MQQPPAGLKSPFLRRPTVLGAAALMVAAILVSAVLRRSVPSRNDGEHRPELAELVTAVGQRRIFEPRITGGFAYAGLTPATPTRSGKSADDQLPLELRGAALRLESRARRAADPLAANAFGIAQLLSGQSERAVSTLERAVTLAPKDSRVLSDMAAAYLVRSRDANQFEDVARAVGFAQKATEAGPQLAEARFNLALSLEGLSLRREATKAWQSYLEMTVTHHGPRKPGDIWRSLPKAPRNAGKNSGARLSPPASAATMARFEPLRNGFRTPPMRYVENDLLPAWADAWLARDAGKARRTAQLARRFGQALADLVGERMALDAAAAIERVQTSGNQERADALARGHQVFREGRALYEHDKVAASAERFGEAQRWLLEGRSPFSEWAALQLAIWRYYQNDFEQSTRVLDVLVRESSAQSHLRLLGRALWMKGLIYYVRGRAADSLDSYRQALGIFDRIGAVVDQAAMHSRIAENIEAVGDVSAAWAHRREALARLEALTVARHRQTILGSVAHLATRSNFLLAAISLQTEVISEAQRSGLAASVVDGFLGRAEVQALAGQPELAARDVAEAEQWLPRIPDEARAERQRAETMLAKGQTLQSTDPLEAIKAFQASLERFP